ncbi:MAG: head GIN domain-containing protein [Bacteroidota bacterium]
MKKYLLIPILAVVFFASCKKGAVTDCFYSTGNIETETRSVHDFNSLLLRDNVNLVLKKSDSNYIVVEAGSNLINGIITDVSESGILEIRNDNNCNWIRSFETPIFVYLNYIDIDSIEYRSIGDITTVGTLVTDSLWIMAHEGAGLIKMELDVDLLHCSLHYGTMDIVLSGKSGLSYVYSSGFGLINMVDIESGFIYVNNRSSNNMYVRSEKHLSATIESIGNIYYAGNPSTVIFDKTGTGELIKLQD